LVERQQLIQSSALLVRLVSIDLSHIIVIVIEREIEQAKSN